MSAGKKRWKWDKKIFHVFVCAERNEHPHVHFKLIFIQKHNATRKGTGGKKWAELEETTESLNPHYALFFVLLLPCGASAKGESASVIEPREIAHSVVPGTRRRREIIQLWWQRE